MVLISAETILPMFLLWSQLCDYFRSKELQKSVNRSPFWIKPEWSVGMVVHTVTPPASKEVGLAQRVGNLLVRTTHLPSGNMERLSVS